MGVKLRSYFYLLVIPILLMGCKKGEKNVTPDPDPIRVLSLSVIDYTASMVTIKVTGTIVVEGVVELDTLQFFEDNSCRGNHIGETLVKNFSAQGAELDLTSNKSHNLYVSTKNSSDCMFFMTYNSEVLAPSEPKFTKTSPESPTRETANPGIFGSAFPMSGSIKFYENAACTQLVGQGSVEDYSGNGIALTLTENQDSNVYGQVEDLLGKKSSCVELTVYSHLDSIITDPVFTASVPISPNNVSSTPYIKGQLAAEAISVTIYSDSACSASLITGLPADFNDPGLQVILPTNSITNLYAKSIDDQGNPSSCTLLTTYVHDTLPPTPPTYTAINPVSPNNSNLFPRVSGTSSSDTLTVKFFDSNLCLVQIGSGSKATFEGLGLAAGVATNSTTSIYAQNFDSSGNASTCTLMTDYKHNTIPPNFPIFSGTTPASPNNNSITPLIFGTVSQYTNFLEFYDEENCTNMVGSGTPAEFEGAGIQLNLTANANNSVYVKVSDLEGNVSSCGFHAGYEHSNVPAPNPGLLYTFPASPTNGSNLPFIVGTAHASLVSLTLYDDNTCTNSLGSGSRAQFTSAGIQITVPVNSTTDIHAIAQDIYGNNSTCGMLTTFIHNIINPDDPVFSATIPVSPNATSSSPLIQGSTSTAVGSQLPPFKVAFYDSLACVNKIGEGDPGDFSGAGIQVNVPSDSSTALYSKVTDEAGNSSNCTSMTNYIHDSYQPSVPILTGTSPNSPSFREDIKLSGIFAASPDFLNRVSVGIYTDSGCTNLLTSGSPTDYEATGIDVILPNNTATSLYAASVNEVGTSSNCQLQTTFTHNDVAPQSLSVSNNFDGGVYLAWLPDLVSSPSPTYTVERSISATGPFSVVASALSANNYTDDLVNDGETYHYRVFATNSTGRSQYSTIENITISVGVPVQATSLSAFPGDQEVRLTWGANINNMTYKIYRATQAGGPYSTLPDEVTNNQYLDESVINNTTYYYVVTGSNPSGESMRSNMASAYPRPVPTAPTNLTIQTYPQHPDCANNPGIQISWSPTNYYDNFAILRAAGNGTRTVKETTNDNKYFYCNFSLNQRHSISVAAQWGSDLSAESNVVYYRGTTEPTLSLDPGDNEIVLGWNQPDGGNLFLSGTPEYNIFRSTELNGPYTEVVSGTTALSYTDSTITPGVDYYYYVECYILKSGGTRTWYIGPHSSIQSASARAIPSAPTNLTLVENPQTAAVELSWTAPSHYNSFNLYHATNVGGPYTYVSNLTTNFLAAAPVVNGMNYFYIKAKWGIQETAATNTVSFRKAGVTGFLATASASDINLTWNAVTGAQDYKVLRATNSNGPYSEIATSGTNSYLDTTPIAATGYYYKVYATFSDATVGQHSLIKSAMLTGSNTPTGVSLEVLSTSTVKVTWVPVASASEYRVYSATAFGGPYTIKAVIPFGSESVVTGLTANTEFFIKVSAKVGVPYFEATPVNIYTYASPTPPTGTVGNNSINVSWTPLAGVVDYNLLRSSDGVSYSAIVSNHPTSSFLDNTVANGQIYFYKLQANYAMGSTTSSSSSSYTPGVTPLAPLQLYLSNNNTGTEILLSWDTVDGASSYNVYVDTSSSHVTPKFSSSTTQNVSMAGLNLGTTYYAIVKAVNGDLESAASPEVKIVTALDTAAPTVQWGSSSSVDVSWAAVTDANHYTIFRSEDGITFDSIASGVAAITYNDSTVDPNKTYFYKYESYNASGTAMAFSNVSSGITIGVAPEAPQGVVASAQDNNSVDLSWITTSTASSYNVMRATSSGGPYSLVTNLAAPSTSYNDASVVATNTYFYVIQAVNAQSVTSANSNEVGVNLNGAPANLIASNVSNGIQLDWDVLGGALNYSIGRSQESGGPYGIISNAGTNTYIDTSAQADQDYYYIVIANFADTSASPLSNEATLTRSGSIDLQVPIELIDTRLASSNSTAIIFERSQTSFNTQDYDGVSSYQFEVIAKNSDSSIRQVFIVDAGDVEVGSINIPANTNDLTRFSLGFTPNVGSDVYRVKLESTAFSAQLEVVAARILVNQVDATKTKLYFPLLSLSQFASEADVSVAAQNTSSTTYSSSNAVLPFIREAADLESFPDYNAWELEALVSVTGTAEGSIVLQNMDTGLPVAITETRFSSNLISLASVPIDDGVAEFALTNEGDQYELQMKCEYDCGSGTVSLHKAGLWVRLENLSKAVSFYRNASVQFAQSSTFVTDQDRNLIDTSLYSNPLVYFQAEISDNVVSSADVLLQYHGNDSGNVGLVNVVGSSISFNSDARGLSRTASNFSVTSGQRFTTQVIPSGGNVELHSSAIVIKSSSP